MPFVAMTTVYVKCASLFVSDKLKGKIKYLKLIISKII